MKKLLTKYWAILALLALALTPLVWFWYRRGTLIDGLDTNFPLDPVVWFSRRFYIWQGVVNAGADMNSSVSGIFFHLIQVIPYLATHSLPIAEVFSIIFWFSAIVISAYLFISEVVEESKLAKFVFVVLYTLNIYLFNTWENVKVSNLALVVGIPLFLALFIKYAKRKLGPFHLFALTVIASLITAGAGINPAYFVAIVACLFIFIGLKVLLAANKQERAVMLKGAFALFLGMFLTNIFWLIPLFNFLFLAKRPGSLGDIGFTDWINSLSQNTSLTNVLRLQGAWDWYAKDESGMPLYIPYAVNYFYKLPFVVFSFVTPFLALVAFALRNQKKNFYYVFFGILSILGIFLSAGVHLPTGYFYEFLVNHIPFFSFFRSPWYIFAPYLVFALAGAIALLLEQLLIRNGISKIIIISVVVLFIGGHLLYSYPLITGKIFRPGRTDSFYVNFPDYVFGAKKWLDSGDPTRRIISYPDDQLETFAWGYRGTDSIISLLSDHEFISPSFNSENNSVGSILAEMYTFLKKGEYEAALSMFKLLGADTLFVKKDISSLAPAIDAAKLNSLTKAVNIGEWTFYQISADKTNSKIFVPNYVYLDSSSSGTLADAAGLTEVNSVSVQPNDSEVAKIKNLGASYGGNYRPQKGI